MALDWCANLANSDEGVYDGMEQGQERKNMATNGGGGARGYNTTTGDRYAKYTNNCEANESMGKGENDQQGMWCRDPIEYKV